MPRWRQRAKYASTHASSNIIIISISDTARAIYSSSYIIHAYQISPICYIISRSFMRTEQHIWYHFNILLSSPSSSFIIITIMVNTRIDTIRFINTRGNARTHGHHHHQRTSSPFLCDAIDHRYAGGCAPATKGMKENHIQAFIYHQTTNNNNRMSMVMRCHAAACCYNARARARGIRLSSSRSSSSRHESALHERLCSLY